MELNTARVFVKDIDAARQFYAGPLGLPLKVDGSPHGYCVFKAGSTELVVEVVAADAPEEEQLLVGRFTGLSFAVRDITEKHRQLVALGVPFTGAPQKQFWGGVLATLQDPSGNELQIVQQPA
ncbi:VOC family protein [Roseateles sp. BYS180W]|uniref:VOC family protein n=1 Tax=Roseateles rivi TaxID=3299028 RepID=A0ABW7FT33_9BURK